MGQNLPYLFQAIKLKKKSLPALRFQLGNRSRLHQRKREDYIKFRRGKPNPIELKEKVFTGLALFVLIVLMVIIWYRQQ